MSNTLPEIATADIEEVRSFWNAHPLFVGESRYAAGERQFFEEFDRTTLYEHSNCVAPIFLRNVDAKTEVLDVGCGLGFWTEQFCRRGARVSACDLTEKAVELTTLHVRYHSLSADIRLGNAEKLPYRDRSFDHINCQGVIHHTPDADACIQEFHRVLKPGGTLCFSVYFKLWILRSSALFRPIAQLSRLVMALPGRGREAMFSAPSPEEFVRMYDGCGNPIGRAYKRIELYSMLGGRFEILEEMRFGFPRRVLPFPIPNLLHRWLSRRFGLMIVLRCRKLG